MDAHKELLRSTEQMSIVERYETFISYTYPIAQNIPRKHLVAKDMYLQALLGQVDLFVQAGKSNQVSRLYLADAGLANLRFWLRFLSGKDIKAMSQHQHQVAQVHLAEVGKMLGGWIKNMKSKGQGG